MDPITKQTEGSPHSSLRAWAQAKKASNSERLALAVVELRQSVWDELWHIARSWRVDVKELVKAARGDRDA